MTDIFPQAEYIFFCGFFFLQKKRKLCYIDGIRQAKYEPRNQKKDKKMKINNKLALRQYLSTQLDELYNDSYEKSYDDLLDDWCDTFLEFFKNRGFRWGDDIDKIKMDDASFFETLKDAE